ncbi:AAA family ATPase [Commensalibacter oyaizuii]|uniref:Chromosome partition protein Smc n=1 Tax=Commensalibacter oyaizuii TaxID=3043873 RepID=A0ABT6PYB1_9PROT|nr:AAA family ATPase [Commensalibacter sp. TBRC 16381]MDI2089843.1 AAA family ATPase [Commensalibacter sp. TBRC 16381]
MSVRFTHLKIAGFKSFSDPITLDILPGLTGIIGPNGCGKSNIVEAIRWVMGESSARSLRGGEMDDVIFAGTVRRAARNIAEVSITLDGTQAIAPQPFQHQDQLQISRQIERGSGSQYRINNKIQRARDVQTLFADLGSGPRSSAIISQNRIAQLISASPEERRQVLEEAAGIAGLYSRRREAELKLKATEENLARLDDVRQQLTDLITSLNEQSTQAGIYRQLSADLREAETDLQTLYFQRAVRSLTFFQQKVINAQTHQQETNLHTIENQNHLQTVEEKLPNSRQYEIQARIKWEQQRQETRAIQTEINKVNDEIRHLHERVQEAKSQQTTSHNYVKETQDDLNKFQEELRIISQKLSAHPDQENLALQTIHSLETALADLTKKIDQAEENLHQKQKQFQDITQQYEQAALKKETIHTEYEDILNQYQLCLDDLPKDDDLQQHHQQQETAQAAVNHYTQQRQALEVKLNDARLQIADAQYHAQQVEQAYLQLSQKIQEQDTHSNDLINREQTLQSQLQSLQHQCLTSEKNEQFERDIQQAQQTLQDAKINTQTLARHYQDTIQKRLEHENTYHQALQTYENHQRATVTAKQALETAEKKLNLLQEQVEKAQSACIDPQHLEQQEKQLQQEQHRFQQIQTTLLALKQSHQQAQKDVESFQIIFNQHHTDLQRLQAKFDGLTQALSNDQQGDAALSPLPTVIEQLAIPPEWITAIATLFDETLETPEDYNSAKGWYALSEKITDFPANIRVLSDIIPPPSVLKRAFDHIGVVHTIEEGKDLFPKLTVGQTLITQNGDLWRWDGYHQKAGIPNKAAQRLIQRQTLKETENALTALQAQTPKLHSKYTELQNHHEALKIQLEQTQNNYTTQEQQLKNIQKEFTTLQNRANAAQTHYDALQPAYQQAQQDYTEKQHLYNQAKQEGALPKPDPSTVNNSLQHEQNSKKQLRLAEEKYQESEQKFTILKENYQKLLHQNQQNNLRIEALKEKIAILQTEHQKLQVDLNKNKELLNHLEHPDQAKEAHNQLQAITQTLEHELNLLQQEQKQAEQTLTDAQRAYQHIKERHIQGQSRLETLKPRCDTLKNLLNAAEQALEAAEKLYATRPDLDTAKTSLQELQESYKTLKNQEENERLSYHLLINEKKTLDQQQEQLKSQCLEWQTRLYQAQTQAQESDQKVAELQKQYDDMSQRVPLLEQNYTKLQNLEQQALTLYYEAQQQLTALEQQKNQAQQQLTQAEQALAKAKENLFKAQAKQEQAEALLEQLRNNIAPEIQELAKGRSDIDISDQAEKTLKATITTLSEQREALGAVNLRAEIEREEKQDTFNTIEKEYYDLDTAIQQLKESINKLNQQGKEKLNTIFVEVNQHFQELFTRMFNGGNAYLKLLPHEDPLQTGLEIFAQPPGKKLSTLSLLSGGEQALTALSLVFAVSKCNPVPICVLDEVDAPLDDPNVERFCALLTDMTEQAGTRFLVVTHHQLTMSHMNRLYGVTMQERGISQIISIDLEHAVQMQQSKHVEQLSLIDE